MSAAFDQNLKTKLENDGFVVVEEFASAETVNVILCALQREELSQRAGTRQLHRRMPELARLLESDLFKGLIG